MLGDGLGVIGCRERQVMKQRHCLIKDDSAWQVIVSGTFHVCVQNMCMSWVITALHEC